MSDDNKSYPPSDLKLERLRRQGIIARSAEVSSFGVVVGLIIACFAVVSGAGSAIVNLLERCLAGECAAAPDELIAQNFSALFIVNGLVFVLIIGCLILVDIVQNKGLFTPGAWRFDLGAPFSFSKNLGALRSGFFTQLFKNGLFTIGWLAVCYLLFIAAFQEIIPSVTMLTASSVDDSQIEFYWKFAVRVLIASGTAAFFFAMLSWFVAALQFRQEHQMSRAELEQEYREMEAPPELRRARQELRDS